MRAITLTIHFLTLCVIIACSPQAERMILPDDLDVVNQQSGMDSVCMTCSHQVVVFYDFDKKSFFPFRKEYLWNQLKDQFPEVGFVFYFSGQDKERLAKELNALEFPFPAYHDPDFLFYRLNNLDSIQTTYRILHSFHLENGFSVKPAQIGMREEFLEEMDSLRRKD